MSIKGTTKSTDTEVGKDMESELDIKNDERRDDDRAVQEDLNQGMETGTHETARTGINWGPSYRAPGKRKPKK